MFDEVPLGQIIENGRRTNHFVYLTQIIVLNAADVNNSLDSILSLFYEKGLAFLGHMLVQIVPLDDGNRISEVDVIHIEEGNIMIGAQSLQNYASQAVQR